MPPGLHPVWRWLLGVVLVVQVGVIAFTGIFGAFKLPYFSPIDESAHYSYIQQIAEHGSLPVLGKTNTSLQALSIGRGLYPHPRTVPLGARRGLATLSYEAFQPPLYYLAAVPAFLITPNYIDKIYAVRLFDVLLLLAAVALAGRLCRVVLKERWLIGWSMVLVFLALPGVVVRMVFISNLALAVPMAILFVTELWIAWHRRSGWRLAGAGLRPRAVHPDRARARPVRAALRPGPGDRAVGPVDAAGIVAPGDRGRGAPPGRGGTVDRVQRVPLPHADGGAHRHPGADLDGQPAPPPRADQPAPATDGHPAQPERPGRMGDHHGPPARHQLPRPAAGRPGRPGRPGADPRHRAEAVVDAGRHPRAPVGAST